ncbi:MAG: methyltransferase [Euryarchaeota archaeon]|nr:methyltransferase [Euryarchaeota archaeon]
MKKLPEVNERFEDLYRMLIGPIRSKLLLTGIELGIFNQLSEPKSAEAVADAIGTHSENTRLFLDGLAASDLTVKRNGLYQNTPVTQAFLVEGSSTFLGQMFTLQSQMWDPTINDMSRLVKEGAPQHSPDTDMGSEEMWAQFAAFMANYERAGVAQQAVEIVSELPEFPSFRKMLDLGGGPGVTGIAIVGAHPSMKGVIFDRPAIIKVAETFITEYEMEDRMAVLAGDYNGDSIGEGYDLIWASNTLNFARHDLDSLMKKIYDALNPGGVFISFCEGLTNERTKTDFVVLSMMSIALMGQDMCFDQGEIGDSMLRVGFKSVRSRTLDVPWSTADLDIGRK